MVTLFPTESLPQFSPIAQYAPHEIETQSMRTIADELHARGLFVPEALRPVVFRAIHASADFDYAENLVFSPSVVADATTLFRTQRPMLITDTNMALAGIRKADCARFGIETCCFMADDDVAEASRRSNLTRAACSVDKAVRLFCASDGSSPHPLVFVCGNAPTALVRLRQLHDAGFVSPALVIGVPVGFVNVMPAKELILQSDMPYIVSRGRKGGSTIAAAIVNALLKNQESVL